MKETIINQILTAIKEENFNQIDLYLHDYFSNLLKEYNFNFAHNKIYSRAEDKAYDEDCKDLHILAKGFNYRLKSQVSSRGKRLHDEIQDAPNSILLEHISKPSLVNDILNYLHCYIFGLSKPSVSRAVNAREFLQFEDLMRRYSESLQFA